MTDLNDYSLRPLELEDAELVLKWRNSERIRNNMFTDQMIIPEEHNKWINNSIKSKNGKFFIFQYLEKPIGFASLSNIDLMNSRCYCGFYIGDDQAPKGAGSIMTLFAIEFAFKYLEIKKIYCEVFSFNLRALKMYKNIGFKEEGHFVGHYIKNGVPEDVISLALFKEEWMKSKESQYKRLFDKYVHRNC